MKAEVLEHAVLELVDFVGVAAEQRELIELRADGALESAYGITREEFLDPRESDEQFLAEHREALRLDPSYPNAYTNLSMALLNRRDFAGALAAVREAIRLEPDCGPAYEGLGG